MDCDVKYQRSNTGTIVSFTIAWFELLSNVVITNEISTENRFVDGVSWYEDRDFDVQQECNGPNMTDRIDNDLVAFVAWTGKDTQLSLIRSVSLICDESGRDESFSRVSFL